jgi:hypothetical protein
MVRHITGHNHHTLTEFLKISNDDMVDVQTREHEAQLVPLNIGS